MGYKLTLNIGDKVMIKPEGEKEFIEGVIEILGKQQSIWGKDNWTGIRAINTGYYHMNFLTDRDFHASPKHLVIKKVS